MNKYLPLKYILICCAAILLAGILAFYFFQVGNFSAYPWWHQNWGQDADGTYTAQTMAMLNGGRLHYVHHPGGSLYGLQGLMFRVVASFSSSYQDIFHLGQVSDLNSAMHLLEKGVQAGRVWTLFLFIGFSFTFWRVAFQLSKDHLISFFLAGYVALSDAGIQHSFKIRPEMLSVWFVLGALSVFLQEKKTPIKTGRLPYLLIGLFLGLAVYAKIQIAPIVLVFACGMAIKILLTQAEPNRGLKSAIILSLAMLVLMPWWALFRPPHFTKAYMLALLSAPDYRRSYGNMPADFIVPIAIILGLVCITTIAIAFWHHKKRNQLAQRLLNLFLAVEVGFLGVFASVYGVFSFCCASIPNYIQNTRHITYVLLTNVTGGGFLIHRVLDATTFSKMYKLHAVTSMFHIGLIKQSIHIYRLLGIMACWMVVRLILKNRKDFFARYLVIALLVGTGLAMDFLATIRWKEIFMYYSIYSLPFYVLAMAFCWGLELQGKPIGRASFGHKAVYVIFVVLLLSNFYARTQNILRSDKESGKSTQDPKVQFHNVSANARPFFEIVEKAVQKKGSR